MGLPTVFLIPAAFPPLFLFYNIYSLHECVFLVKTRLIFD